MEKMKCYALSLMTRRNFYILFTVILLFKMVLGGVIFSKKPGFVTTPDSADYINFAKQFVAQGLLLPDITSSPEGLDQIGPGYPLLMSLFYLFSENNLWQVLLNVVMGHFIAIFVFKISLLLFTNNEHLAYITGILAMCNPITYFFSLIILKETISVFLFIWMVYLAFRYFFLEEKDVPLKKYFGPIAAIGVVSTYLIHSDERFVVHILLIIGLILTLMQIKFKKRLLIALSYGLFILALSTPWAMRNNLVFGRPLFLSLRTAPYSDPVFSKLGLEWEKKDPPRGRVNIYTTASFSQAVIDSVAMGLTPVTIKGRALKHVKMGLKKGVRPYTFSNTKRYWSNFVEFFRTSNFGYHYMASGFLFDKPWSLSHNFVSSLSVGIFYPGLLIALLGIKKNKIILALFLFIALHAAFHIFIEYVTERYRFPVTPMIIIIGIYGYNILLTKYKAHKQIKLK